MGGPNFIGTRHCFLSPARLMQGRISRSCQLQKPPASTLGALALTMGVIVLGVPSTSVSLRNLHARSTEEVLPGTLSPWPRQKLKFITNESEVAGSSPVKPLNH